MNSKHFIFGAAVVGGLYLHTFNNSIQQGSVLVPESALFEVLQIDNLSMARRISDIAYLPNGRCEIPGLASIAKENYKDYVRACINNRYLRYGINN